MPYYISRNSTSSTSYSSDPQPLWDPRATLQISNDCRCVGSTTKGRKCLNPIAQRNLVKADTLLHDIARQQPDSDALRTKLRRLAEHSLCVRWHQNQARDMVEKWTDRMMDAYPNGVVESTRRQASRGHSAPSRRTTSSTISPQASPSTSSRRTDTLASSMSASTSASLPDQTQIETLHETIATMQEALRTAQRHLAELEHPPPSARSSPTVSRVSTSDISSLQLSRSSTIGSSASNSTTRSSTSIAVHNRTDNTATPPRSCTRTHIRRRAIDDECPICQEAFLVDERLVWCKSSCGRSVHKDCFEEWRSQCEADGRTPSCAICRAVWESECGCDE